MGEVAGDFWTIAKNSGTAGSFTQSLMKTAIQRGNLLGPVKRDLDAYTAAARAYAAVLDDAKSSPAAIEAAGQRFDRVGIQAGDHEAYITEQRTVRDDGYALASTLVRADGAIAGSFAEAFGGRGRFIVVADEFGVISDDMAAEDALRFFSFVDGVAYFDHVRVRLLDADVVTAANMRQSAAQQTIPVVLTTDVQCPNGVWTDVVTMTVDKQEADSLLKIVFYGAVRHPDDLIFQYEITVDGVSVSPARRVRMPFDNSGSDGQMPITPFAFAAGLPAGPHTIRVRINNQDTEGPLTVYVGSAVEVVELKKAVL